MDLHSWCEDCMGILAGSAMTNGQICPQHGPLQTVADTAVPPRAVLTAPSCVVIKRLDPGPDGRIVRGVFARTGIERRSVFGPVEAQMLQVALCVGEDRLPLKVFRAGVEIGHLDVSNDALCNWLIYVRPAHTPAQLNLLAFQCQEHIYFLSLKDIPVGEELRVWYGEDYGMLMGVGGLCEVMEEEEPVCAAGTSGTGTCSVSVIRFVTPPADGQNGDVQVAPDTGPPSSVDKAPGPASSSRRKATRPQRVPQTASSLLAPPFAHSQSPSQSPRPLYASSLLPSSCDNNNNNNNILLIYDTSASGGQGGSLLLLTPGPAPGTNASLMKPTMQLTSNGLNLALSASPGPGPSTPNWRAFSSNNPLLLSSSEESMLSERYCGENGKSPQSPSMNSDDGSNMDQSLLQSSSGGSRPYSCSYPACNKFFSSKYKLLRHELIHSQEKRHHCPLCHKKFHRKDHLNNHLKVHERSKVRLECLLCGCIFAKKWTYEKHLALHERDQALDPEARSQLMAALEARGLVDEEGEGEGEGEDEEDEPEPQWPPSQIKTETIQEPVILSSPPKKAGALNQNQKPAHPCQVCGKVFSASKDLRRHLQTHLGIKPNLCPYCPKKFTRKDHVRRHITTVHAELSHLDFANTNNNNQHQRRLTA